ncbi:hypothetical protein KKI23_01855 [Patescibacteria group bacterium]|nr:hypothetical protein [Patescibacteria group bacterium]
MLNQLEKSILATIVYFDIFDFPLTVMEVWKWLWLENSQEPISFNLVRKTLSSTNLKKVLSSQNGFYFLQHRSRIVDMRLANYKVAERKYKKAIRYIRLLNFCPFIKMVAICNSLAFSNAGDYADIDFFIISKKKRIWLARLWANFFPQLLGLRPTRADTQDKLCLTFFISEEKLDISSLRESDQDIYLAYWVAQVLAIYDPSQLYPKFMEANDWVKKYLPNTLPNQVSIRRQVKNSWLTTSWRKLCWLFTFSLLGNWQELLAKKIQLTLMPDQLKTMANQDTKVVITDQVLKFHDNDRRRKFRQMFEEKMVKITNYEK